MRLLNSRFLRLAKALFFLGVLSASAQADPLTTFTLTDLGPGTPTFALGASGGIVFAGDGQTAYPFQKAQDTTLDPQQLLSSKFPLEAPPSIYSNGAYNDPSFVYSKLLSAITNGQGTFIGIDASGVYGHEGGAGVYFVKQNPDGTWSTLTEMWSAGPQYDGRPEAGQASITGVNKLNEVLGLGSGGSQSGLGLPQTYLYEVNSRTLLNLGDLNVLQSGGWNNLRPIAIDDQGRILLQGFRNPVTGDSSEHSLLLTPQGVSSGPLAVPAPEPGAWALAVLTIAGLALRRTVRCLRHS